MPLIIVKDRNVYSTPSSPIPNQISKWIENQQKSLSTNTELQQQQQSSPSYNCKFSKSVPDFNISNSDNSKFRIKDICGTFDRLKPSNSCNCKLINCSNSQQRSKSESLLKAPQQFIINNNNENNRCLTPSDNVFFSKNQQQLSSQSISNDISGNCYLTTSCCSYCSINEQPSSQSPILPTTTTSTIQLKNKKTSCSCSCSCCSCCYCCGGDQASSYSAKSLPEFTYLLSHIVVDKPVAVPSPTAIQIIKQTNNSNKKENLKNNKTSSSFENTFFIERELSSSSNSQVTSGCDFFNKYFDSTTTTSQSNTSQNEQELEVEQANMRQKKENQQDKNLTTKVKSKFNKFVNNFHNPSSSISSSSLSQQSCSLVNRPPNNNSLIIKKIDNLSFFDDQKSTSAVATASSSAAAAAPTSQNNSNKKPILSRASFSKFTRKTSKSTSELDNMKVNLTKNKVKLNREASIKTNKQKSITQHQQTTSQSDLINKKKLSRTQKSKTMNVLDPSSSSSSSKPRGNLTM